MQIAFTRHCLNQIFSLLIHVSIKEKGTRIFDLIVVKQANIAHFQDCDYSKLLAKR